MITANFSDYRQKARVLIIANYEEILYMLPTVC